MRIPRFWAEHRSGDHGPDRRWRPLHRFGWSDESQAAAEEHARERTTEALAVRAAGRSVAPREHKVAYNGAEGLPIREEVLESHPSIGVVVTRNAYGAACLNTPDVLFVDVDAETGIGYRRSALGAGIGLVAILGLGGAVLSGDLAPLWSVLLTSVGLLLVVWLLRSLGGWRRTGITHLPSRLRRWCAEHPDWRVHRYDTPAGARLLVEHATFAPLDPEVQRFFRVMGADPVYVRMCRAQRCFRARISPKPWRIGITDRIGWHVWPPERPASAERRAAWVRRYEERMGGAASCRHRAVYGSDRADLRAAAVRTLHDARCQAGRDDLPLA